MGLSGPVEMDAASKYDAAAQSAACAMLLSAGSSAVGAAAWSAVTGGPVGWGVAAAIAGVSGLAYGLGCGPDWDNGDRPAAESNDCWSVTVPGTLFTVSKADPTSKAELDTGVDSIVSVTPTPGGPRATEIKYMKGGVEITRNEWSTTDLFYWTIDTTGDCNYTGAPDDFPPPPDVPPHEWEDPDDGCKITANFEGFLVDGGGNPSPVFKLEPSDSPALRSSGGLIGGCNFSPVIHVYNPPGGGGGGGGTIPYNPAPPGPGGEPWWVKPAAAVVGGVAGAIANQLLDELLEKKYPANSREIYAACEFKEDGSPETFSVNFPEEPFPDRVLTALDAIVDFQQQFFLWKRHICKDTPTPQTGDAVTINWISDQRSLASGVQLKKLFTYFDHNDSTLEATVAHWRDFTWNAGPVIVSCVGTQLGKPQVWAESEEEAKRVINHAAAIAGIDTSDAEWLVGTPKSTRYGLTGLMRVHRAPNGVLGITKRVGPSGLPEGLS